MLTLIKAIRYTADAAKDLKRYSNMAARVRPSMREYAETDAHSNNVTKLVGSDAWRMRVGSYRVIFEATDTEITITKVGPRGGVYD